MNSDRILSALGWLIALGVVLFFATAFNPWVLTMMVLLPAAAWITLARAWPLAFIGALFGVTDE
jgi:hypothetical protein